MPVGTGISAQQGMLSILETKGLGNIGGWGGGGVGEAKQLLFTFSFFKNAVTIAEV